VSQVSQMTETDWKQLQADLEQITDEIVTDAMILAEHAGVLGEPVYPGRPVWTRALAAAGRG
jgi:hypothetical protein